MERALIEGYERRVAEVLGVLSLDNRSLATQIAALPLTMRGYGHVKLANVVLARAREAELLHQLLPERHGKPPPSGPAAGSLRGIAVVAR
jgi:indolepyruvate ferredoxin oxidoreductase